MFRGYRKIPKISPEANIFQRPFLRGLYSEGLICGGKFAFQNRLGWPYSWKEIDRFCFILVCICYLLIHGGAFFRNFTVCRVYFHDFVVNSVRK